MDIMVITIVLVIIYVLDAAIPSWQRCDFCGSKLKEWKSVDGKIEGLTCTSCGALHA